MANQPWMRQLLATQQLRESIASVSLSHPETCNCDVCKAAKGDEDALVRCCEVLGEER